MKKFYNLQRLYKLFIADTAEEIEKCKVDIYNNSVTLNATKKHLTENKEEITKMFGIILPNYLEYSCDTIDSNSSLLSLTRSLIINKKGGNSGKLYLAYIIRYIKLLQTRDKLNRELAILNDRCNLSVEEYRGYIRRYYIQVQREVLDGRGYMFSNNLGTLLINRVKVHKESQTPVMDYKKSRENKERLIEEGKIPYSKKDHDACIKKDIPYYGVKYLSFKKIDVYYESILYRPRFKDAGLYKFKNTRYRAKNLQFMTEEEVLSLIHTREDIYNLDCDLKTKLQYLNLFDDTNYVTYIRNNEQNKYNYRKSIR